MKPPLLGLNLLLVDDDPKLCALLKAGLAEFGVKSSCASTGKLALDRLKTDATEPIDIVLLDIMMPGMDGWECLEQIKSLFDIPVIFVTAKEDVADRVNGLRLGADDYIIKPFAFDELVARVESVLRRSCRTRPFRCGTLEFDLVRRYVKHRDEDLALSPKEFDLLLILANNYPHPASRSELLKNVWLSTLDTGTNIVDVHISRLRRKLWRPGSPQIESIRGLGYKLVDGNESAE